MAERNLDTEGEGLAKVIAESFDTKVLAKVLHVEPNTIRRGYCLNGAYMGLVPVKLPNGRLLWPAGPAKKIASGEVKK